MIILKCFESFFYPTNPSVFETQSNAKNLTPYYTLYEAIQVFIVWILLNSLFLLDKVDQLAY